METLNVTPTRKSPETLSDLGFQDGDLVTVSVLIDAVMEYTRKKSEKNRNVALYDGCKVCHSHDTCLDAFLPNSPGCNAYGRG